MAIKTFTAGSVLTASDTNTFLANAGLVYVGGTTFTTSANPFVNGCFTSVYQNYRIVISIAGSTSSSLRLRMRSGVSTPETTAVYDRWGFSVNGGVVTNETVAAQTSLFLGGYFTAELTPYTMDMFSPNEARRTNTLPYSWNSATGATLFSTGRVSTNTVYTGIELICDAGTITGSMRIYGYRQV
jgi:hypothetical protein